MTVDESLKAQFTAAAEARRGSDRSGAIVGGGGGGPHMPDMDARMSAVEAGIARIEVAFARVEATLPSLATKADVVKVEGMSGTLDAKLAALDARMGRVESNVATALTTAIGKAIGPIQFLGILSGAAGLVIALTTLYTWASHQGWFPR